MKNTTYIVTYTFREIAPASRVAFAGNDLEQLLDLISNELELDPGKVFYITEITGDKVATPLATVNATTGVIISGHPTAGMLADIEAIRKATIK